MAVMRKATSTTNAPHLFSSVSALSAESKSYSNTLRFVDHGVLQTNQSNFLIFNLAFVRFYKES